MNVKQLKQLFHSFAFSDKVQENAFRNLLRFVAIIIVFAIVSRGTQSAFMPSVTLCATSQGTIDELIEATGFISLAQGIPFTVPSDILIETVMLTAGKEIKQGDGIAAVSQKDVDLAYKKIKAQLGLLQAQFNQQSSGEQVDDYSVKQAQAELDKAYAEYNNAATDDERTAALSLAQNAESARNAALHVFEQAAQQADKSNAISKANAMVTLAQIDSAKSQLEQLEKTIKQNYIICAEADGIITELRLTSGEKSGQIGGFITDKANLSVFTFNIAEEQAQLVKPGIEVTVLQENAKATATVDDISPPNENGEMKATVNLQSSGFKVGNAEAKIYLSRNKYEMCLPQNAVYTDTKGSFVFVLEQSVGVLGVQSVVRRVFVTVQKQSDKIAAVTGALDSNSKVILSSSRLLQDGARVKVEE